MKEKLYDYDFADGLQDQESIETFMNSAFETGNAAHIANAFGIVARAKGMKKIAKKTGLSREQLYQTFSENGNPTLKTILSVMNALGFDMMVKTHVVC